MKFDYASNETMSSKKEGASEKTITKLKTKSKKNSPGTRELKWIKA